MIKVIKQAKGTVDVKRFYLDGCEISCKCPKCGNFHTRGLDYFSYPKLDKDIELFVYCPTCKHEWYEIVRILITLQPQPSPTVNEIERYLYFSSIPHEECGGIGDLQFSFNTIEEFINNLKKSKYIYGYDNSIHNLSTSQTFRVKTTEMEVLIEEVSKYFNDTNYISK